METFSSYADEEWDVSIDASDSGKLPAGTSIVSATVEATDLFTERVDNSILSSTAAVISGGNIMTVGKTGGIPGRKYQMVFTALLSDGSVLREPVIHLVKKLI